MKADNHQAFEEDIEIVQLTRALWKEKAIILFFVVIFTLMGLAFSYSEPTYIASVNLVELKPEEQSQLKDLSLFSSLSNTSPLLDYIKTLNNPSFQKLFIQNAPKYAGIELYSQNLSSDPTSTLSGFLTIQNNLLNKKETALFPYTLQFRSTNRNLAEKELYRLTQYASEHLLTTYSLRFDKLKQSKLIALEKELILQAQIAENERYSKITRLEEKHLELKTETKVKLETEIRIAKAALLDRINTLKHAYMTAELLSIKKPARLSQLSKNTTDISIELIESTQPLYMLGTELLDAEITQLMSEEKQYISNHKIRQLISELESLGTNYKSNILKLRKSDLPFNPKLQKIENKILKLNAESLPDINLNFSQTPIFSTHVSQSTKKAVILALFIAIGLMLGISASLIKPAICRDKKQIPG